jgi:hypothetical protein
MAAVAAVAGAGALPAHAAIAFERMAVHQYEDGPILPRSHAFLPGETVFFSCRISGYQIAGKEDEPRSVKIAWQVQVSDPTGRALTPGASGRIEEPVSRQDKNWLPKFLYNFEIPPFVLGGTYHIKASAKDEVGGSEFSSQLDFNVRGHIVEPSGTLTARNLRFLAQEKDGPPLDPAVYHPGQTLWARFEITGYQYGEKNRYSVEYGLAILRETGEQVFAQPAAAADSNASFYPQPYVPGQLSLNLDSNVPLGNYTMVITIEDKIGNQTAEVRGMFRIE